MRYKLTRQLPAILDTLTEAAKGGDIQAAKLILERTLPVLKSAAEPLTLPAAMTPAAQGRTVLEALALGEITPTEAQAVMSAVAVQAPGRGGRGTPHGSSSAETGETRA